MKNNKINKIKLNIGILSPRTVYKNAGTGFYERICGKYRVKRLLKTIQELVPRRFRLFAQSSTGPEGSSNPVYLKGPGIYNISGSTKWMSRPFLIRESRPGASITHAVRHIHNTFIQSSGYNQEKQPEVKSRHGALAGNVLIYKEFTYKPYTAGEQNANNIPDSKADHLYRSPVLLNISVTRLLKAYGQENKALPQEVSLIGIPYINIGKGAGRENGKSAANIKIQHQVLSDIKRVIRTINVQWNKACVKYLPNEAFQREGTGYQGLLDKGIQIHKSKESFITSYREIEKSIVRENGKSTADRKIQHQGLSDIKRVIKTSNVQWNKACVKHLPNEAFPREEVDYPGRYDKGIHIHKSKDPAGGNKEQDIEESVWQDGIIEQAAEYMAAKPVMLLKNRIFQRNSIKRVNAPGNLQFVSQDYGNIPGVASDRLHKDGLILNTGSGEFYIDEYTDKQEYFGEPESRNLAAADVYGLYGNRHMKNVLRYGCGTRDGNVRESAGYLGNHQENISTGGKGLVNDSRLVFYTPPGNEASAVKTQGNYKESFRSEAASSPGDPGVHGQQRKNSNFGQREINILAEQVLKVLEKKAAIQKDRRGLL